MATRINPCHGCPAREGCAQHDDFRERVSGLGLRSATFRCARLDAELRPGRRITVRTPHLRGDGPDCTMVMSIAPATITGSHDGEFTCTIDPGHVSGAYDEPGDVNRFRFRKSMAARRIVRFLDEPDMPVCKGGRVQRGDKCDRPYAADGGPCYCQNEGLDLIAAGADATKAQQKRCG